jgi:hypothetical protein
MNEWENAEKAWLVCASIHREFAKGKDALFKTRQADFLKNAKDAKDSAALSQKEYETVKRDAQRYRWLRRRDVDTINLGGLFVGKTPENIVITDIDLDVAIDTAMLSCPQPAVTQPESNLPKG